LRETTEPTGDGTLTGLTDVTANNNGNYAVDFGLKKCLALSIALVPVSCFGGTNGSATVSVSAGGTAPFNYDWSNVAGTNNPASQTGLAAGTYTVTVTDANMCSATSEATITQPASGMNPTITPTNVACFGGTTGAVSASVTGGTAPYNYDWSNVAGTNNPAAQTGLAAGTYTITITDFNGCTTVASQVITQPSAALSISMPVSTNILCFGGNTGAITAAASSGTPTYIYDWSNVAGTNNPAAQTGLVAGTYTVTVTDVNLCTQTASVTLTQPVAALSAAGTMVTNVLCYGQNTGAVTAVGTGGTIPYTYDWSNVAGANNPAAQTGLALGLYTVTITDGNLCTSTFVANITQPSSALNAFITSTNIVCFGASTGSISVTPTGGTSPYTYDWSNLAGTNDPAAQTGLPAGTYTVTVTDANLCTVVVTKAITQPTVALTLAITPVNINIACFGANTGAITGVASGGTPNYTYDWSNLAGAINPAAQTGLAAGTYTVTVTDANLCTQTSSVTVTQPPSELTASITASINILCYGQSTGSATAAGSGGTAPYTYDWSNVSGTNNPATQTGLAAGTYTVTVSDANSCTKTVTVTITQPSTAVTAPIASTAILCNGGSNGTATVAAAGGTGPYTYDWNNVAGANNPAAQTGLSAGTYTVTATDANGCTAVESITLTAPPALVATASFMAQGGCTMPDGTINLAVTGGTPGAGTGYTYDWSNLAGTNDPQNQSGVGSGTYTVTVTDANNCTVTSSVIVAALGGVAASVVSVVGNNCQGTISLAISGGSSPITYDWSNNGVGGSDPQNLSGVGAGTYTVTVTAGNGCTATASATYLGCDQGDLPDPTPGTGTNNYQTLITNGGPNHEIVPGFFLGASIDQEPNGQPQSSASGDLGDEDGLTLSPLQVGQTAIAQIAYTVPTGPPATIAIMLDFNDNGVFEPSEIFTATVPGGSMGTQAINIPVPTNSVTNNEDIGVRLRLTTNSAAAANPNGPAPNGEVEDYTAIVACTTTLEVMNTSVCSNGGTVDLSSLVTNSGGGTLSYYATQANAEAGTNPLPSSTVTVTSAQNYYIRTEVTAGCYAVKGVSIVLEAPTCGVITVTGTN
jgi:hypothetical protein